MPQGGSSTHCPEGAGFPAETLEQDPFVIPVCASAHAWHRPVHASLQQKPSTQKPVEHSLAVPHAWPVASPPPAPVVPVVLDVVVLDVVALVVPPAPVVVELVVVPVVPVVVELVLGAPPVDCVELPPAPPVPWLHAGRAPAAPINIQVVRHFIRTSLSRPESRARPSATWSPPAMPPNVR